MKRYNEMTDAELLELTNEQIATLIDYECALDGVPMLPPDPGPAPTLSMPPMDTKVYEVVGVLVMDSEHAGRILDAITSGPLFKTEYGSNYLIPHKESDYSFPEIKTKSVYSQEQWATIAPAVKEHETAKKEYDRTARDYNEGIKARKDITDAVNSAIRNASDCEYERQTLRREFARYLELAEGNKNIAMNFPTKAKSYMQQDHGELVQELCPGYGIPPWKMQVENKAE